MILTKINKKVIYSSIFMFSLLLSNNGFATTTTEWGVEEESTHVMSLKLFNYYNVDYTALLGARLNFKFTFNSITETGYNYTLYNSSNHVIQANITNFQAMDINDTSLILPDGLFVALPLKIAEINNYPLYLSSIINETKSLPGFENVTNVLSSLGNNSLLDLYSTYSTEKLKIHLNFHTDDLNDTLYNQLLTEFQEELSMFYLPVSISELTANITITFCTILGLLDAFTIQIKSKGMDIEENEDSFNANIRYERFIPSSDNNDNEDETTNGVTFLWLSSVIGFITITTLAKRNKCKQR